MKKYLLTIEINSELEPDKTVERFQKFFDYFHPSLNAKVQKQVEERHPVEEKEDLL